MRLSILFLFVSLALSSAVGQDRLFTRTGYISFFSSTPIEAIKAENKQVTSFLDKSNGELVFSVLMNSFEFEKALMQEHFNENYVESVKYPKATFKGKITDPASVAWGKPGEYKVKVQGEMDLHGVKKKIEVEAVILITNEATTGSAVFELRPEDYNISIPQVVRNKIAEKVQISVKMNYQPYKSRP